MKLSKSQRAKLDREAVKANERIHDELHGMAGQIANDQGEWLDKVMKDILPPKLYEAGRHGDLTEEIKAYLKKHGFNLVFIPDSMSIRLMRGDQIHAQFETSLTLDGEPIEMRPTGPLS